MPVSEIFSQVFKNIDAKINRNNGAHNWTRTSDLSLTKGVLYRLSYVGLSVPPTKSKKNGAGDGNRTHIISLEG